jgi:hypothetical protein
VGKLEEVALIIKEKGKKICKVSNAFREAKRNSIEAITK